MFDKVVPNQRFGVTADTWNGMMDAARAHAERGQGTGGAGPGTAGQVDFVKAKNTTVLRVAKGQFIGLGNPIVTYNATYDNRMEFFSNPKLFVGEELAVADHSEGGKFGIALENIEPGQAGRIAISGIFPCKLNITAETDEYATIADAQPEALDTQSDASSVRIWWKETGTGTGKWGLVELGRVAGGGGSASLQFVQAVADGSGGVISVKEIAFKADVSASPNFEQTGDAFNVNYFKA